MKYIYYLLAVTIPLFISLTGLCTTTQKPLLPSATISVKLNDPNLKKEDMPSIVILISKYPFGGAEFIMSEHVNYEQDVVAGQSNTFSIAAPAKTFYMHISYRSKRVSNPFYWIDNIYILKAGDQLQCELRPDYIQFSGKGAGLLNCQSEIYKHIVTSSEQDRMLFRKKEYASYFKRLDRKLDSCLSLRLHVIEAHKKLLGDDFSKILTANCYGLRYYSLLRGYSIEANDSIFFNAIKKHFQSKKELGYKPLLPDKSLENSPIYTNYLIEEMNLQERMKNRLYGGYMPDSSIHTIINKICMKYNGPLKDKLLTLYFVHLNQNPFSSRYIDAAIASIKKPLYKEILLRGKRASDGRPFKDFLLPDSTGRSYSLNDFRNKIVVMDFWYTGCENCIYLNQGMKPVYKHFEGDDRIVFVSVSIDKNKSEWINSIKKGLYTHEGGLNLYTNGSGVNNELIAYYNIVGFPRLMILKDGIILSAFPPKPVADSKAGLKISKPASDMIKLLEGAIKEK